MKRDKRERPSQDAEAQGNRTGESETEGLAAPTYRRDVVNVKSRGYGNYDIVIPQFFSQGAEKMVNVAGRVERNKLTLYDPNVLNQMPVNAFGWNQVHEDTEDSLRALEKSGELQGTTYTDGDKDAIQENLKWLEGDKDHYVYVTLNQRMPYEAFKFYIDKNEELRGIWCAVSTNVPLTESVSIDQTLGFSCTIETSSLLEENPETYPELFLLPRGLSMKEGEQQEEELKKESYMKKHFASQLRYLADQKRFLRMIYPEADSKEIARELKDIASYVEKHGLLIHGFACRADKEALLKLVNEKNVYDIMPAQ